MILQQRHYPNPFNASTSIRYNLPSSGNVEIAIYNVQGQLIRILLTGRQRAGTHTVIWDGKNGVGKRMASGIYFFKLRLNNQAVDLNSKSITEIQKHRKI